MTKELFAGAETSAGPAQRGPWPEHQHNPRDHLLGSSGNPLHLVEKAKKLIPSNFLIIPFTVYIHICTKYFVNKFSTLGPGNIIVAFGKFYKKCFPPRAKTGFCLSNQKPRVNILEPRHLIVN